MTVPVPWVWLYRKRFKRSRYNYKFLKLTSIMTIVIISITHLRNPLYFPPSTKILVFDTQSLSLEDVTYTLPSILKLVLSGASIISAPFPKCKDNNRKQNNVRKNCWITASSMLFPVQVWSEICPHSQIPILVRNKTRMGKLHTATARRRQHKNNKEKEIPPPYTSNNFNAEAMLKQ